MLTSYETEIGPLHEGIPTAGGSSLAHWRGETCAAGQVRLDETVRGNCRVPLQLVLRVL